MTVVTRKFADITKRPDYYKFQFETGLRRSTDDPDVTITPKRVDAVPATVGGEAVLSVDLDPGPCRVWYRGVSHIIEIPETGPADLQDLIEAGTVENGAPEIPSNSVTLRGRSFAGFDPELTEDGLAQPLREGPDGPVPVGPPVQLPSSAFVSIAGDPSDNAGLVATFVAKAKAATGSASTDVANLASALAARSTVIAEGGIYQVTKYGLDVSAGKALNLAKGSKIKLANGELNSVNSGLTTRAVQVFDGGSFFGEIDGNRTNQSKTAFNAAGGTFSASMWHRGLVAAGTAESPLKKLTVDARISGVVDNPASFEYVKDSYIRIRASDCGGPVLFRNCDNLDIDIEVVDGDNLDWKILQHAVDVFSCSRIRGRIVVRGQKGTGSATAGTGLSNWITGVTISDCRDIQLDCIDAEFTSATSQTKSLGLSIIGTRRIYCSKVRVHGYSDQGVELGGVVDAEFSALDIDGRYAVPLGGSTFGYGISLYNNAYASDFLGRTLEPCRNVRFVGGSIRRFFGVAANIQAAIDTSWHGVSFSASRVGLLAKFANQDVGEGPSPAPGLQLRGHSFFGCDFTFNERSGVEIWDLVDSGFYGCRSNNNSQAVPFGTTRSGLISDSPNTSGFYTKTSTNKTGLVFDGDCQADDTQGSSAPGFPDPSRPSVIAVDRPDRYGVGQAITIVGAGPAGADLITRIDGIQHDELTLQDSISTFPTSTLTGTISTSGTSVTGLGTSFSADLVGRVFVKVGSNYRRIAKVADNTHATLASAFPSDVAPSTPLTVVRSTITTAPTQCNGFSFSADTISPLINGSRTPSGNTANSVINGTSTATALRYTVHTAVLASATASAVHAATSKTSPADADELFLADSAASYGIKKLTWANLKSAISTYFSSATLTLSNKRLTPRIGAVTSSATPTPDADVQDQYNLNALNTNAVFGAPTGSPVNAQRLPIRIKDDGTPRTLSFNAIYRFFVPAPTTTVAGKVMYLICVYNANDSKWDVIDVIQQP